VTPVHDRPRPPIDPLSIRALRPGHGANCSSIGSVVDTLFVTALLGGALFAAVVGALAREPIEVIGPPEPPRSPPPDLPPISGGGERGPREDAP
jgi:hypothetical protein